MLSGLGMHVAAVTLALTIGGCSFSYKLDSLFEKSKQASVETTASVAAKPTTAPAKPQANDGDLAYARAAASEVLRSGGNGVSQPWENPRDRCPRHRHPHCFGLYPRWLHLPGLSRELCARRKR